MTAPFAAGTGPVTATGLTPWTSPDRSGQVCWVAPPGSAGVLSVDGGTEVAELLWSTRASAIPSTRAVVFVGADTGHVTGVVERFEHAHRLAEEVATTLSGSGAGEVGPIEVLVLRPEAGSVAPRPEPTAQGARFRFLHDGGVQVDLALEIPHTSDSDHPQRHDRQDPRCPLR